MSTIKHLLFLLALLFCSSCVKDTYEKRVSNYMETLTNLDDPKEKVSYMMSGHDILIGVQIPPFRIAGTDGEIISNESIKGKLVLLNFWFIECPSCIEELPTLDKIHEIFNGEKFEIISICRNSKPDLEEFLLDNSIPYRVAADGRQVLEEVFQWPFGYAANILVDEKGKIINVYRALIDGRKNNQYEEFINEVRNRL